MNEWCEHKTWRTSPDDWNFCPICGAKRPERKKKLWEILNVLKDDSGEEFIIQRDCAKLAAQSAIEAVEEVVDELTFSNDEHCFVAKLKHRLRELL